MVLNVGGANRLITSGLKFVYFSVAFGGSVGQRGVLRETEDRIPETGKERRKTEDRRPEEDWKRKTEVLGKELILKDMKATMKIRISLWLILVFLFLIMPLDIIKNSKSGNDAIRKYVDLDRWHHWVD